MQIGIRIDPDRTREDWLHALEQRITTAQNKAIKNLFEGWWPTSLALVLLKQIDVAPNTRAAQVSRAERKTIAELLFELRLTLKRPKPIEQAMVTASGVEVREVDPKTMESKKQPGLFLAGEVLDVDGVSGGYNLQAAYSTGWVAGRCAALRVQGE